MKFYYPRPHTILSLLFISFFFSCSEDYLLKDNEAIYAVNATAKTSNNITLTPIQDAHLTGKIRYNLPIVGVSENKRVAYLMFDLSKIDGEITSATLQITAKENPDTRKDNPGHGITRVYTGSNSNWSEVNLSSNNQPKNDKHLGDISTTYTIGSTQSIKLNVAPITNKKTTLILSHKDGKGYTFSSRETSNPPRLILTTTSATTAKSQIGTKLSADVLYWKELYDTTWAKPGSKGKLDAIKYASSNGANQEYYYLAWHLDGLIQIWQATGDNKYLNDAIQLIQHTINNAVPVHKGKYKGWPATKHGYAPNGYPLWDSFLYKHVASLLRIMYKSPNLRMMRYGNGSYQNWYDKTLAFVEKNIWDKWYNEHPKNLYRSNTHMASHWARIGMELYIITGKQQYLNVFNNISYAGFPKGMQGPAGSSLRKQMFRKGSALIWNSSWGSRNIQDTSHGADVVSFWVTARENKMYWSANDMNGLISTLNNYVWKSNSPILFAQNTDGSGRSSNMEASFHNFITLGRFNQELQNRIRKYYNPISMKHKTTQAMGIAALNQKILEDGRPVYPEQY